MKWEGDFMNKLASILLAISLMSMTLLGCESSDAKIITKDQYKSESNLNNTIITREIDIDKNKNLDFVMDINDPTKKNGVFEYNKGVYGLTTDEENKILVLFNGIDGFYSDVNFSIKNKVLTISYKYNTEKGLNKKSLFMIDDTNKTESYDTVDLIKNGKQDSYESIHG
jgi:hypothetical protein